MHRMTHIKPVLLIGAVLASLSGVTYLATPAHAEPPRMQIADLDYEASGFVLPAGATGYHPGAVQQAIAQQSAGGQAGGAGPMIPAQHAGTKYSPTPYAPAGYSQPMPSGNAPSGIAQVGYFSGGGSACDAGCCGGGNCGSMGCGQQACGPQGACGPLGMGYMHGGYGQGAYQDCEPILSGGVLGKMRGGSCGCGVGGACGCGSGGEELSGLRHICMFCRGGGCSACQMFNPGALIGALAALRPHGEAGLCAQRWYDLSAEALFMGRTTSSAGPNVITQRGAGGPGTPVLFGTDAASGDLEAGMRLSAALIFGAGGNIEATYMGGQEWKNSATVTSPADLTANVSFNPGAAPGALNSNEFIINSGADLYSFISEFGTDPIGGFDDTDRSVSQSLESEAHFHSGEINYRRRTVGPYCRFQGSWMTGLRYLRYDDRVGLNIIGLDNDGIAANGTDGNLRYFSTANAAKNDMLGAQIGGDLWWNMIPGVSLGVDGKLAWLKNDASNEYTIAANSISGGGPGVVSDSIHDDNSTLALEFQTKMVYRLSHSWTFRSAYYLVAIDEVATSGLDGEFIRNAVQTGSGTSSRAINYRSLVLNGFSLGAEYTW